jgi:predicted ATP-grasp superfamily ATP-dependent carboligase
MVLPTGGFQVTEYRERTIRRMTSRPPQNAKPLRVLLSEGSSTSAREAITILGLNGHIIEVCDPSSYCLGRFSRFVSKFHHCPGLRDDPAAFLRFVEELLAKRHFDVLLPIHEQGFLFARAQRRLKEHVGFALPTFDSYRIAHRKAGFTRLLEELGLPHPETRIVRCKNELRDCILFPCVIKTSVGTASRGVWFVANEGDLRRVTDELDVNDAFADEVLVQRFEPGVIEKAQAVFCRGRLIGFHAYRQIAAGAGGGDAVKQSVERSNVRDDLVAIAERLAWHGALSVDYILAGESDKPLYIDCNPRLVEPMSAYLAGVDLVALLLEVSRGETPLAAAGSRAGVRTHLAMQALLGCALRGGERRDILRECGCLLMKRGPYTDSREEMTPVRLDWVSAVPLAITALALLVAPKLAHRLVTRGWGAHLLDIKSIRAIESESFEWREAQP